MMTTQFQIAQYVIRTENHLLQRNRDIFHVNYVYQTQWQTELPSTFVSKRVFMQNPSYENKFDLKTSFDTGKRKSEVAYFKSKQNFYI